MVKFSDDVTQGVEKSAARAMLRAVGLEDEDFNKGVFQSIFEEGRLNLANRERLFGTQGTFGGQPLANGGIASLTRTTPPKRSLNKDSQGLASLPEYDR